MTDEIAVTRGSGNVFADLGFANPEEELLKAQLVREIRDLLKRRRLTQAKAAELLGLKQPDVSGWSTAACTSSLWSGSCAASAVSTEKSRSSPGRKGRRERRACLGPRPWRSRARIGAFLEGDELLRLRVAQHDVG